MTARNKTNKVKFRNLGTAEGMASMVCMGGVFPAGCTTREGQIWIRIFPDKPITKKPNEVRMGKGKGAPEYFVAPILPGRIMFEAEGVPVEVAREALRLAAQKLPIKTKFVVRRDYVE